MKKNIYNNIKISENLILEKFFSKLNFNKSETFNFKNDAAFLKNKLNHNLIATNDSIAENIDFFKNDNPKSIAHKIITSNLSDLSAMGAKPYSYMLNLCLNKNIDFEWLKIFTNHLLKLQKKYNFFLLGGDLSKSNSLMISATFYGYAKSYYIIPQIKLKNNDDIWVTGTLGNSFAGFKINKSKKIYFNKKIKEFFLNKYFYPNPCMIGYNISKYCTSAIDISDGFFGDLDKMLNNKKGAFINTKLLPLNPKLQKIIKNNHYGFNLFDVLNWGDDYELILTANKNQAKKIQKIAKLKKIKITKVGQIINKLGIYDHSFQTIDTLDKFDHFA